MQKERNIQMFDYEAYLALQNVLKAEHQKGEEDAKEWLSSVEEAAKVCFDYVNTVNHMEVAMPRAQVQYDPADYREFIQTLDRQRRAAHESAIIHTRILNRIAKLYGCKPIFLGDSEDRYNVADFCIDITNIIFKNRTL